MLPQRYHILPGVARASSETYAVGVALTEDILAVTPVRFRPEINRVT